MFLRSLPLNESLRSVRNLRVGVSSCMPEVPENDKNQDAGPAPHSTSATGQIAEAVADLIKAIVSGIPTGKGGVVCRFLIIFEVLLTVVLLVAMTTKTHDLAWGGLIGMVAGGGALIFSYGTADDNTLSVGQEARAEGILGTK